MRRHIQKLGETYLTCSTHLFSNFARRGIAHWWEDKPGAPKGGAVFAYYDAEHTCLRLMPKAPQFFQAALRNNLISHADATRLGREYMATLGTLLEGYTGYFSPELRSGPIGQSARHAAEPANLGLFEAHHYLGPDEIYAEMPWPLMPRLHFELSTFAPAGIRASYIGEAAQNNLQAMTIAVDLLTWGPSLNLTPEMISAVLEWLRGTRDINDFPEPREQPDVDLRKILVPSYTGGFQGVAFGIFGNLPSSLEPFVLSQMQQFSATIGEHLAYEREQDRALALDRSSSLADYATAFIGVLPPVEHAVFTSKGERVGFALRAEDNYLAGYRYLQGDALAAAYEDNDNDSLTTHGRAGEIQIQVKMPADATSLSPVFTAIRLRPRMSLLPPLSADEFQPLSRSKLGELYHALRRQLNEGRGALAASKKLLLIELALQNFDKGEVTLSNSKARQYTEDALGKPVAGYHVAGKAAKKYEQDIRKLAPDVFVFEAVSQNVIRVRWRPNLERVEGSRRLQSTRRELN